VTLPVYLILTHYRGAYSPRPGGKLAEVKEVFFPESDANVNDEDSKGQKTASLHQSLLDHK
jgi:hypothetical protein